MSRNKKHSLRHGALALILTLLLPACQRSAREDARQLVARYNSLVAQAYRQNDVKLIDPVVGNDEGRKIAGLIGVRKDFGLALDSEMRSLEVTSVRREGRELRVRTRERWRYRDVKISTGQPSGEESLDAYEMLYVFRRDGKNWLVDEIHFTAEPKVGRKTQTWAGGRAEKEKL